MLTRLRRQTQTCLSSEAQRFLYSVVSTAWKEEPDLGSEVTFHPSPVLDVWLRARPLCSLGLSLPTCRARPGGPAELLACCSVSSVPRAPWCWHRGGTWGVLAIAGGQGKKEARGDEREGRRGWKAGGEKSSFCCHRSPAASQAPHFWFTPQRGTCEPHLGVLSRIWAALLSLASTPLCPYSLPSN